MGNNYDSMAGAFSSGKALGMTAFGCSLVACSVWPLLLRPIPAAKSGLLLKYLEKLSKKVPGSNRTVAGIPGATMGGMVTNVPARLMLIITDTGAMLQACSAIDESGAKGRDFLEVLNKQYYSIGPTAWEANDQKEYQKRLGQYRDSVVNTCCLAEEAAMLTAIVGSLRFAQHLITSILTGILAVLAAVFWAVVFIPVVGQAWAASIRTAGTALANMLPTIIRVMDEIMAKVGLAHASLLAVRTGQAGISDEMRLKDGGGLGDLGGAGGSILVNLWGKIQHMTGTK